MIDSFDALSMKPIRDIVYDKLRYAIFKGEFDAGDRLVEEELAEKMHLSRTPIREALRKLEAEGLVEHIPRKGVIVKGFTYEDIIEIYSIRQTLEVLATIQATKIITAEEIDQLQETLKEMKKKFSDENEVDNFFAITHRFNELLIQSCKMPRLIDLLNTYHDYLKRFRKTTLKETSRRYSVMVEHERILQAVIEKDVIAVEKMAQ